MKSPLPCYPATSIVFASDGIHESTNRNSEEYGIDRLKALLATVDPVDPGYTIAQRIVKATDEHTGAGLPSPRRPYPADPARHGRRGRGLLQTPHHLLSGWLFARGASLGMAACSLDAMASGIRFSVF